MNAFITDPAIVCSKNKMNAYQRTRLHKFTFNKTRQICEY